MTNATFANIETMNKTPTTIAAALLPEVGAESTKKTKKPATDNSQFTYYALALELI